MKSIQTHTTDCGLQIVTESIPTTRTVAMNWGIQAGVATNTIDGDSVLLAELVQRGAGIRTAKEHNNALDSLGVKRQISCGVEYFRISGVMLGNRFENALPLLSDYLLQPKLPEQDLDACKSLCVQSIHSLADNPSAQVSVALNSHHITPPYNRSAYGDIAHIESATIERLRDVHSNTFVPHNSIITVAGDIKHQQVIDAVNPLVHDWNGTIEPLQDIGLPERGNHFIEQDTSQVHIGIAFDAPNATEADAILASVAISIFGGATSGRLFTQVRQRRSLCYSVSAHYAAARNRSVVRMFAGTTPQRADETVQVCLEQLALMRDGITLDEFTRTIQRLKSRTVMRGESTTARANALWGDQYALKRTRTLLDVLEEIDAVTLESVNDWLQRHDFGKLTLVTLGPKPLQIDDSLLYI